MKPDTFRSASDLINVKSKFSHFCEDPRIDLTRATGTFDVTNSEILVRNVHESFIICPAELYNHPFNIGTGLLQDGLLDLDGSTFSASPLLQVLGKKEKQNSRTRRLSLTFEWREGKELGQLRNVPGLQSECRR